MPGPSTNMMRITAFFLILLFCSIQARAAVYKYTDENGILFFTDKPENIPESQRHTAERIETAKKPINRWINHPASKAIIIIFLLIVMLFLARRFFGYLFPQILIKLLVVLLLGTIIYSIVLAWKTGPTSVSFDADVEPYLPSPTPINRAKEAVKKLEESQKKQEELIDKLQDSEGN